MLNCTGNAGFRKCRHAGVAYGGGTQQQNGDSGARGFAETHVEIQQGPKSQLLKQESMSCFSGNVCRTTMIQYGRFEARER